MLKNPRQSVAPVQIRVPLVAEGNRVHFQEITSESINSSRTILLDFEFNNIANNPKIYTVENAKIALP
jgi:hypothetical protein